MLNGVMLHPEIEAAPPEVREVVAWLETGAPA